LFCRKARFCSFRQLARFCSFCQLARFCSFCHEANFCSVYSAGETLLLFVLIHLLVLRMSSPVLVVQVASAPPGTQACSFDIKTFHRTCPVTPHHKPWLIVQGPSREDFFIDHVHPFGAASASGNAGMIGNAAMDIWIRTGVGPVVKYEDDCNAFRSPVAVVRQSVWTIPQQYQKRASRRRNARKIGPLDPGVPSSPPTEK